MKTLASLHTKRNHTLPRLGKVKRSADSGLFVIGADAPPLSEKAKEQLNHKRPSKRAAKLAAVVAKANVRCSAVV
jgi:hypothetical protein